MTKESDYLKIDQKYNELLTETGNDEIKAIQELYSWALVVKLSPSMLTAWMAWKAS